jgi:type I restriction enzyme S subunit
MTNWKKYKLGDLVTFQRGHDLPQTEFVDGKYPIVASNGIIGYHNEFTTTAPGLTVGRSGNIGKPFFINEDFWAHNTTLYVKEFKNVEPKFIYYLLQTINLSDYNSGSAVPTLNRNYIHPIEIEIPESIAEQQVIASVLSSLDDKIELNRRQNETMEKIAQAIFKHWFVDFNFPDEKGKPYKDSGGEMVESELGLIPKGWRVGSISEFITVKGGTHDSPKSSNKGYFLITSKHIGKFELDFSQAYLISEKDFTDVNKRSQVDKNDILITMIGTVGNIYLVKNNVSLIKLKKCL